jgi:hypothetical protein
MTMLINRIKVILNIFASIILITFVVIIFTPSHNTQRGNILSFSLSNKDIIYNNKSDSDITKAQIDNSGMSDALREEVLNRAKAMTEVKWTPKCNLIDKKGGYIFTKWKIYNGVPYSMDTYLLGYYEIHNVVKF